MICVSYYCHFVSRARYGPFSREKTIATHTKIEHALSAISNYNNTFLFRKTRQAYDYLEVNFLKLK